MSRLMPNRALKDIRDMFERWLVDEVEVWRGESSTLDEDTLVEEHVPGTMIWSGKARIRPTSGPREQAIGEGVVAMRDCDINFHLDAPPLRRDDEVRVVRSDDQKLVGHWFRLTDVRAFSQQASQKTSAIGIQSSRLWQGAS